MGQFHRRLTPGGLLCHLFFAAFSVCFILPVVLVVVISFSSTESINQLGFSLFPKAFSLEAYQYIFKTPRLILFSYGTTIFVTAVGTLVSLTVTAMLGYSLSRTELWQFLF